MSPGSQTSYVYDPANNLVTETYPNGLRSTIHYDSMNRLTAMTTPNSGYLYQLGATGNRTSATELTGRSVQWSYDGIYRLTNEAIASDPAGGNGAVDYGLDPVGNRLSSTSSLSRISTSISGYDSDDLMSAESYDANGNTVTSGGRTFAYDSENHLTSMNNGGVTIIYDGDGNRVSKTASGVTTLYLVDDLNPTGYAQVIEEVSGGAVQREYTYGLQRINENQIVSGTWTPSFYGYDGGGTVRQLTNLAAAVTDRYNYDAFGNLLNSSGTTPNNYLYRGEQYDQDLGLYYLRARYYNPATGRFLSRDPGRSRTAAPDATRNDLNSDTNQEVSFYLFGGPASTPVSSDTQGCLISLSDENICVPQAQHKYNYANSDPIDRIDPSGRDSLIEFSLEDSEIEAEEEGVKAGRCAVVKNLCWSGCFVAVTSAGIHGADAFGDTRACTRRCMAAAGCFNY